MGVASLPLTFFLLPQFRPVKCISSPSFPLLVPAGMCCYVCGMCEPLLLLPPPCSTEPFLWWPGLSSVVLLHPCWSCVVLPCVAPGGLCGPRSSPGGSPVSCGMCMSLCLGFFGGRGVSHCLGAQSECPGLPFLGLPDCVGVRFMSVCGGGLCVPSRASLTMVSPHWKRGSVSASQHAVARHRV